MGRRVETPNTVLPLTCSIPKYRRYEKRHKNLAAHCSPAFRVENGDTVTVGELFEAASDVPEPS